LKHQDLLFLVVTVASRVLAALQVLAVAVVAHQLHF
jgi:hypothetical protein